MKIKIKQFSFPSLKLLSLILSLFLSQQAFAGSTLLKLDPAIHFTASRTFVGHQGRDAMQNYLTLDVPFAPAQRLYDDLKRSTGLPLQSRGEAHITVITPVEYRDGLSSFLTMEEVNRVALEQDIQASKFEILGLGKGEAFLDSRGKLATETTGKLEYAYFLIVKSENLLQIRRKIAELFVQKGGRLEQFNPGHFYPHITLGFTKRDLFEGDGVMKDVEHSLDPAFSVSEE